MQEALKTRMGQWRRVRLFLVGDGGAGKTSVLRWLKGDPFDEEHKTTDGAVIETLDLKDWEEAEFDPSSVVNAAFAKILKEELESHSASSSSSSSSVSSSSTSPRSSRRLGRCQKDNNSNNDTNSSQQSHHSDNGNSISIADDMVERLHQRMNEWILSSCDQRTTIHVWDCGGQEVYYNTHHFFFTSSAIYLIVVNLSLERFETRGIDRLHFWIRSIRSYAPEAPIRVIVTHTDVLVDDLLRKKRLKAILQSLKASSLRHINPPLSHHLIAISCKTSGEKERHHVRTHLLQLATVIAGQKECLLKWILFFDALYEQTNSNSNTCSSSNSSIHRANQSNHSAQQQLSIIKMEEARHIATKCGLVDEKDLMDALQFFHKQGMLLYFNENKLKDSIFLQPKQLVDAFRTIINNALPQEEDSDLGDDDKDLNLRLDALETKMPNTALLDSEIEQLRTRGSLNGDAMQRIWNSHKYSEETQEKLRALLIKFGLAVDDPDISSDGLVLPCLVQEELEKELEGDSSFIKWSYSLESIAPPLGFASLLVVRLLQLATTPEEPPVWQIYRRGCYVMLEKIDIYVRVLASSVEFFLEIHEDKKMMAIVIRDIVKAIRSVQQSFFISGGGSGQPKPKGQLSGKCLRCNSSMSVAEDLQNITSSYSQFCCQRCRRLLSSYLIVNSAFFLTNNSNEIQTYLF